MPQLDRPSQGRVASAKTARELFYDRGVDVRPGGVLSSRSPASVRRCATPSSRRKATRDG